MGQRFQIIVREDNRINIYHCQWLWGSYVIRRIGTAIKHFLKSKGYDGFEDSLKCSFYRLKDSNSFSEYFSDRTIKRYLREGKTIWDIMNMCDNNDGFVLINIKDRKLEGYTFISTSSDEQDFKPVTAKGYMKHYSLDNMSKGQRKEYEDNMKYFLSLRYTKNVEEITQGLDLNSFEYLDNVDVKDMTSDELTTEQDKISGELVARGVLK